MGEKPWRDKEKLEKLYKKCETQQDVADRLNTTQNTISRWLRKHNITSFNKKHGVYFRENKQDNHFQINVRGGPVVSEHSLNAIAAGCNPHFVFSEETHVHHKNHCTLDNRKENLLVVRNEKHQKIHQNKKWAQNVGYLE